MPNAEKANNANSRSAADLSSPPPSEKQTEEEGFFISPLRKPRTMEDVERIWKEGEVGPEQSKAFQSKWGS